MQLSIILLKKKESVLTGLSSNMARKGGDCNTVDLRGAASGEEGPNTVSAPHEFEKTK